MKNCIDYISQDQSLAPYLPIKSDGQLDREVINKLVAEKKLQYTRKDDKEVIKSENGIEQVTLTIHRNGGLISAIESARSISGRFSIGPNKTITDTHSFQSIYGHCVPTRKINSEQIHAGVSSNGFNRRIFDAQVCRKLQDFYRKNPMAKFCSTDFAKTLAAILKDDSITNIENDQGADAQPREDVHVQALREYDTCTRTPGLKEAVSDDSLWKVPERNSNQKNQPTTTNQ
jgi:hypothetical protein